MAFDENRATSLLDSLLERVRADANLGDLLGSGLDPAEVAADLSPVARSIPVTTWVGLNGNRVDVVLSDGKDEWRVVFGTGDGRRVEWLVVHGRPPYFAGISGGRAVVVNGPSGAGKSTVLESIQRTAIGVPWVIFDEPEHVGAVGSEYLIWRDQTPSLQRGYLAAIGALAEAGNFVAVAAAGRTQADFECHLAQTPTVWVGLYCDHEVLLARERNRADRWGGLADSSLFVHEAWRYDLTFDTTDSPDPAGIAADILTAVEAGRL